jgi:secreted trypsin-like serine protease
MAAVAAACACGGADGVRGGRAAIVGGAPSDDASVVLLRAEVAGREVICSATVIAPRVALTAAHCLDPALVGEGARFTLFVGATLPSPAPREGLVAVRDAIRHPAYQLATAGAGNDIGLVVTSETIGAPARTLNRVALDDTQRGAAARLVGYGVVEASDAGETTLGTRREVVTTVGRIDARRLWFLDGAKNSCTGDSGGPALVAVGGEEVVAGVISFGDEACASYGTATRVDVHADSFVQPVLDRVAAEPAPSPMPSRAGGCAVAASGRGAAPAVALLATVVVVAGALRGRARCSSDRRRARSGPRQPAPPGRAPRPALRRRGARAA